MKQDERVVEKGIAEPQPTTELIPVNVNVKIRIDIKKKNDW